MKALLKNKIALITGASGSIGQAIARKFAAHGAELALHYHSRATKVDRLREELEAQGIRTLAAQADVQIPDEAQWLMNEVVGRFGRIDILVNNAGTSADRLLHLMNDAQWDEVIATNLTGTVNCTRAALTLMIKSGGGKIVNLASATGLCGQATRTNYGASKAAIIGLTRTLAREFASKRIYVNAIAPAIIDGGIAGELPFVQKQIHKAMTPLKRMGHPREVADAALFLASEMSDYITGEIITVSGGEVSWYL
jgi:3-oxoacyl-[acyl-carrier protein] reductase